MRGWDPVSFPRSPLQPLLEFSRASPAGAICLSFPGESREVVLWPVVLSWSREGDTNSPFHSKTVSGSSSLPGLHSLGSSSGALLRSAAAAGGEGSARGRARRSRGGGGGGAAGPGMPVAAERGAHGGGGGGGVRTMGCGCWRLLGVVCPLLLQLGECRRDGEGPRTGSCSVPRAAELAGGCGWDIPRVSPRGGWRVGAGTPGRLRLRCPCAARTVSSCGERDARLPPGSASHRGSICCRARRKAASWHCPGSLCSGRDSPRAPALQPRAAP